MTTKSLLKHNPHLRDAQEYRRDLRVNVLSSMAIEGVKKAAERALSTREGVTMTKHFAKGLDGRMQDKNGEIRQKRSDTKVETLRNTYGSDFAKGYRSDARLGTVLKREGMDTLDQLLKKK